MAQQMGLGLLHMSDQPVAEAST